MSAGESAPRREAPKIPTDMNAFNQAVIDEYRKNHGELSGQMAGRSLILLTTTGVKSGQPRTVVLGYGKDGDRLVVIASKNGAPANPTWYDNLQAKPTATVEIGADKFEVRARTARGDERQKFAALIPFLESQQKLTKREIPVVVLERPKSA